MTHPILIAFISHDGQTARIAHRLGERLAARHLPVDVVDLGVSECSTEGVRGVVFGAPVRYGRFPRAARHWVGAHRAALNALPGAFYGVSLVAGSARPQDAGVADRLRDDLLRQTGWTPALKTSFAGALRYPAYNPLIRWMMRRIAGKSGGSTDTSRGHDYTDWAAVDAFAGEIADRMAAPPAGQP